MKIKNINIENFRNIIRANINFGNINIFTGRNSSGKSNLLLAISESLETDLDFSNVFYDNIVTFGPGKSKALFRTTIDATHTKYLYSNKDTTHTLIEPKEFVFENMFSKKSMSSISHKLYFTGIYATGRQTEPQTTSKVKMQMTDRIKFLESLPNKENFDKKLVYEKNSMAEKIENLDGRQVITNNELTDLPDSQRFFHIFSDYRENVISWIGPMIFSSTNIYEYVIERIKNNEIYDQVVNFLKDNKTSRGAIKIPTAPFPQAKFINLLADVQKHEKQRALFRKDLKFYTDGILTDIYVNIDGSFGGKGEIVVESINTPRDIFSMSAGTAVIIYFILLKNWLELEWFSRSFTPPDVMIFDEVDSIIHPSLMSKFTEILKILSNRVQLFVSTHSPNFIDCFNKDQVFWLKDNLITQHKKGGVLVSSVYSYKEIIDKLPKDNNHSYFLERTNSDLFINGLLDSLFPLI